MANRSNNQSGLLCNHPVFLQQLRTALRAPLPGLAAQREMAAPDRVFTPAPGVRPRQAAIIVILYPRQSDLMMIFTRRTLALKHHSGQICFPGGRIEDDDETIEMAALREAEEELGAPMQQVQILGRLTPLYVSASHNMVHPVIGWLPVLPDLTPNPFEVESVLHIPLSALLNPATHRPYCEQIQKPNEMTPCYWIEGLCIWGATAMMTSELVKVINTILENEGGEESRGS